jgi:hypothetical protein
MAPVSKLMISLTFSQRDYGFVFSTLAGSVSIWYIIEAFEYIIIQASQQTSGLTPNSCSFPL